jgi:hypothetical protein
VRARAAFRYWVENMADDAPQNAAVARAKAIKETAGYVRDTIKFFDDELDSELVVQRSE